MNLLIALLIALAPVVAPAPPTIPPCATDETGPEFAPCYWDATHRGNHTGTSFVWTGGETIYF